MRRIVHDLPLQIVERHLVVIDDADRTDTGCCKVHRDGRAKAACPDDQHTGGLELLLTLAADFPQDKVTLVALYFVGGQDVWCVILHACETTPRKRSASRIGPIPTMWRAWGRDRQRDRS